MYNYETTKNFTVTIVASDEGSPIRTSESTITVTITDKNDNKPQFTESMYNPIELNENTSLNYIVRTIEAIDADSGVNSLVTYSLANGQGKFIINGSGVIQVSSSLDREVDDFYELTITARDSGNPSMSSSVGLNITVLDDNDNAPMFNTSFTSVDLSEDSEVDTQITSWFASDEDINENSEITFKIQSASPYNLFSIEQEPSSGGFIGRLKLAHKVDYENQTTFSITIRGVDNGSPSQSSATVIIVNVVNTNDNPPKFTEDPYEFSVSESAPPNTQIGTVVASDADIDLFGTISSYSFATGTSMDILDRFSISASTGIIRNKVKLDHEMQSIYHFNVAATDGGGRMTTVPVSVNVLNENEHAPNFTMSVYTASVSENLPAGESIGMVSMET